MERPNNALSELLYVTSEENVEYVKHLAIVHELFQSSHYAAARQWREFGVSRSSLQVDETIVHELSVESIFHKPGQNWKI